MRAVIAGLVLAATAWFVMFSPWTAGKTPFWIAMAIASGGLGTLALLAIRRHERMQRAGSVSDGANRSANAAIHQNAVHLPATSFLLFRPRWIPLGLAWAAGLYGLFFLGDRASKAMVNFAGPQIADIYSRLPHGYEIPVALLLLLWIGPAEEIFWRGMVQQRLETRLGRWGAMAIASVLYAAVHAWSMNLMLVLAALLCGLAWGALFARTRNLWPCIISHAIWDVTIFVIFPIR